MSTTSAHEPKNQAVPTRRGGGEEWKSGASDLVLRKVSTGQFQVYNIANNQIMGAAPLGTVGLEWQLGGSGADPPMRMHWVANSLNKCHGLTHT
jgi:hypothetical protein